jgi:hypothetical protein
MGNAARLGAANAASTKEQLVSADTYVRGELDGGQVWFPSGTNAGSRRILKNTDEAGASKVRVAPDKVHHLRMDGTKAADAFTVAPDGTSNYHIHCGWEVVQATAITDVVTAVSLGAVTDGGLTIVAVEGEYVDIFCKGDVDALTAGGLVMQSSTSGVSKGQTGAGLTAVEAARWYAQSYDAYTGAGALRVCRLTALKHNAGGQRIQYQS